MEEEIPSQNTCHTEFPNFLVCWAVIQSVDDADSGVILCCGVFFYVPGFMCMLLMINRFFW